MSEDEKKAIEMLNKDIAEHKFFNIRQADNLEGNIEISINLIEKQQKEIDELKQLMTHKNEYTKKLEEDLYENASNYVVSRDKIRDKIKELYETKQYWNTEVVDILKELLEEE